MATTGSTHTGEPSQALVAIRSTEPDINLRGEAYDIVRRWPQEFVTASPVLMDDGSLLMDAIHMPFAHYC